MLSGWPNVYKLKIDSSKIDSDLTNFPVQIALNSNTGINGFDASKIFDDLDVSTYNEYFTAPDGTPNPDPNKWYVYENPLSTFEVKNNKMYFYSATPSVNDITSYMDNLFYKMGDFDIQIDFEIIQNTAPSASVSYVPSFYVNFDNGSYVSIGRIRTPSANQYAVTTSLGVWTAISVSHDTGKLRITRSGSTIKGYYWTGSQWEWNSSTAGYTFSDVANTTYTSRIRLLFAQDINATVEMYVDNFIINSGSVNYIGGARKLVLTDSSDNLLYTEVENWDTPNKKATLWTRVPTVSSGTDTNLYLYYNRDFYTTASGLNNNHYTGRITDINNLLSLNINAEGTYDTTQTHAPWIIKESNSFYKMWYSGYDGTSYRIIYATSSNGIAWSNFQLVVDIGSEGTYDNLHAYAPCVIKESDSSYKMWYTGSADGVTTRIIYATSTDGIIWSNFQLVIDVGSEGTYDTVFVGFPCVIRESSSSYKIWYAGHSGVNYKIFYATSTNGTTWSNYQIVLNEGTEGMYDSVHAAMPFVIKESESYYRMWYTGRDATNFRIIYITSTNGTAWTNPILSLNNSSQGVYDTLHSYVPRIIKDSDYSYKIWYSGNDSTNVRIIYASYWNTHVWDNNFISVYHMSQDPNIGSSSIKDSSAHHTNGTPAGSMTTSDLIDYEPGLGIDFDGSNDEIQMTKYSDSSITLETVVRVDNAYRCNIWLQAADVNNVDFWIGTGSTNATVFGLKNGGTQEAANGSVLSNGSKNYLAGAYDASTIKLFTNLTKNTAGKTISPPDTGTNKFAVWNGNTGFGGWADMVLTEARLSNIVRSDDWLKASYYSNFNDLLGFYNLISFSSPIPEDLSTVYGFSKQLGLITTISGEDLVYYYDASFYNAVGDSQIGSTISGVQSGNYVHATMSTVSGGVNYQWYVIATSSGISATSDTYTFTNRFLCEGVVTDSDVPASGIPVRLYRRSTGELVGSDTSSTISGVFSIATDYNEYHFIAAFYDSNDTNAVIADWLMPG